MNQAFRWNIRKKEQLGGLIPQRFSQPDQVLMDALYRCTAKIISSSQNMDLVFVGRSLENMHDLLSGVFTGTSWMKRCHLLNVSLRQNLLEMGQIETKNRFREALRQLSLEPKKVLHHQHGFAFIDVVASGQTFGLIAENLLEWAAEEGIDQNAIRQKLRFIGVTWQKHTSPKTWRWQQHTDWVKAFPAKAVQNVSLETVIWSFLANTQDKVTPSNYLTGTSQDQHIPRDERHLQALGWARQLFELGLSSETREALAVDLAKHDGVKNSWVRSLILELRGLQVPRRFKRK